MNDGISTSNGNNGIYQVINVLTMHAGAWFVNCGCSLPSFNARVNMTKSDSAQKLAEILVYFVSQSARYKNDIDQSRQ